MKNLPSTGGLAACKHHTSSTNSSCSARRLAFSRTAAAAGRAALFVAAGWALAGCGGLLPAAAPPPAFYTLQGVQTTVGSQLAKPAGAQAASAMKTAASTAATALQPRHTLLVSPPSAAAGYNSNRIVYTREPHRLETFARSEWVDTPARMLAPLLVTALMAPGRFDAVVQAPSQASGSLRLETQVLRLQQAFDGPPSRVHFALRAQLIDAATQGVIGMRDFEYSVPSASEDPAGGVAAAQLAVQAVLGELVAFCVQALEQSQPVNTAPVSLPASRPAPVRPSAP